MASVPSPQEFDISPVYGFIPEKEPLQYLPEYFSSWEELARSLPQLVSDGDRLRQRIQQLPLLDHNNLSSEDEWKRAHLVLSCTSQAYVWCKGEAGVVKILPKCLAVPWVAVSNHLGIPPVITHTSFMLNNWKYIDPSRPLSMDNLEVSVMITGSSTEQGFVKVPLQVEIDFGKGLHSIIDGQESVQNDDRMGLLKALKSLRDTIVKLTTSFLRTHDIVDPDEFYNNMRPYLAGWKGNPALPDGLIYEGVSESPLQYSGGSAAESSVFQVLDAALGVSHSKDTDSCSSGHFLEQMRQYMPPKHRAFIEAVSQGPSIRNFALTSGDPILVEEYNQCVEKLKDFRNTHLQVVARSVGPIRQQHTFPFLSFPQTSGLTGQRRSKFMRKSRSTCIFILMPANRGKENKELGMALRGTGGSGLISFLKQIRDETSNAISSGNNNNDTDRN